MRRFPVVVFASATLLFVKGHANAQPTPIAAPARTATGPTPAWTLCRQGPFDSPEYGMPAGNDIALWRSIYIWRETGHHRVLNAKVVDVETAHDRPVFAMDLSVRG